MASRYRQIATKNQSVASTVLYSGSCGPRRENGSAQTAIDRGGERAQDALRLVVATGHQTEARQRDHGVAPPVGEPGIARDHRRVALAAAHQKLVGGEHESARGCGQARAAVAHARDQLLAPAPLRFEQRGRLAARHRIGRDHDAQASTKPAMRGYLHAEHAGSEQVLVTVEAAVELLLELEAQPPVGRRLEPAARTRRWTAGAPSHADRRTSFTCAASRRNRASPSRARGSRAWRRTDAARSNERGGPAPSEPAPRGSLGAKPPRRARPPCSRPRSRPRSCAARRPRSRPRCRTRRPGRDRARTGEPLEPAWSEAPGNRDAPSSSGAIAGAHRLVEPRQQHHALDRRPGGRDQETVVATGVRAGHGGHRPAAEAVRLQPLEPRGALEVAEEARSIERGQYGVGRRERDTPSIRPRVRCRLLSARGRRPQPPAAEVRRSRASSPRASANARAPSPPRARGALRTGGHQLLEQARGLLRHRVERAVERFAIRRRRLGVAAHLAHVLQRGVADLLGGGRWIEIVKRVDVAAHAGILAARAARGLRATRAVGQDRVVDRRRATVRGPAQQPPRYAVSPSPSARP